MSVSNTDLKSDKNEDEEKRNKSPVFWAWLITVPILIVGLVVFLCKDAWVLDANEIGDFLAGFAGSLSFVWIISTILLQKEELALQRGEIAKLAQEGALQSSALTSSARSSFINRYLNFTNRLLSDRSSELYNAWCSIILSIWEKEEPSDQIFARDPDFDPESDIPSVFSSVPRVGSLVIVNDNELEIASVDIRPNNISAARADISTGEVIVCGAFSVTIKCLPQGSEDTSEVSDYGLDRSVTVHIHPQDVLAHGRFGDLMSDSMSSYVREGADLQCVPEMIETFVGGRGTVKDTVCRLMIALLALSELKRQKR